jgi:hypothetical protein
MTTSMLLGDQPQAYNKLYNFINNTIEDQSNIFRLIGSAGTGKSTIIALFVLDLIKNTQTSDIQQNKIYFLASTNKAVKVLKEKTDYIDNKNIIFQTIDKFLMCIERIDEYGKTHFSPKGLKVITVKNQKYYVSDINYHTGNPLSLNDIKDIKRDKFLSDSPLKYCKTDILNNINYNDLVIIDECSMLNNDKWNLIKHFCKCKIICMGDKYQLEPINDRSYATASAMAESNESNVFDEDIPPQNDFELKQILRTDNSQIHKIYEVTRNFIDKHPTLSEVCIGLKECNVNKTGLKDEVIKHIKNYLETNKEFIVLSYRNKTVDNYSSIINKCLEDTKVKKYGYFINTKYLMKSHYNRTLTNNTEFEILDVIKENNQYIIDLLTEDRINMKLVVFEKVEYDKITSSILGDIDVLKKYNTQKSYSIKNQIKKFAEEVVQDDKTLIKNYPDIVEGAIIKKKQDLRMCILKNEENFCLCYSLTIHKSQGSSFDYCIVDLRDIYDTRPTTLQQKAKLLYVASSRCVENILFYM